MTLSRVVTRTKTFLFLTFFQSEDPYEAETSDEEEEKTPGKKEKTTTKEEETPRKKEETPRKKEKTPKKEKRKSEEENKENKHKRDKRLVATNLIELTTQELQNDAENTLFISKFVYSGAAVCMNHGLFNCYSVTSLN